MPDSETIRRTAEKVIHQPDYQIDPLPDTDLSLLATLVKIVLWALTPFRWLFDALDGLPDVLRWAIVIGLGVLLLALIAHLAYTLVSAVRGTRSIGRVPFALPGTVRDPEILEKQAQNAEVQGDHLTAVRLLFQACLLRLEAAEKRAIRAGVTDREVLRRHRETAVFAPLRTFVETIETRWYGQSTCDPSDFEACRRAHLSIVELTKTTWHAQRA